MRAWARSGLFLLALSGTGCVDKEKCDEALRVARDSLSKDQPAIARQWRERAWNLCNDQTTTATLDKEITDKEAEIAKKTTDTAKAVADAGQQRMRTASQVWRGYDALPADQHSAAILAVYHDKASKMSQGLPADYSKQIDDYNEREYNKRKAAAK
jgi:hypothetical protein